jgi:ABC-type sugar transport system ATPase subunit
VVHAHLREKHVHRRVQPDLCIPHYCYLPDALYEGLNGSEHATLKDEYHVTTIVVSHDRELALGIADRVGILMGGELVSLGTTAELKTPKDPRVAEFLYPKIDLKNPRFKKLET